MPRVCRLVCDGNSITQGTAASNAATTSYPPVLRGLLHASQATHPERVWSVWNTGVAGASTPERTSAFAAEDQPLYNRFLPLNVAVFFEVRNDLADGASTAQAITHLEAWIVQARAAGWRVMLCTVPPNAAHQAGIDTVNAHIRTNAATLADYPLVDIAADPRMDDPADTGVYADGLHPNDAGYAIIAELVHSRVSVL